MNETSNELLIISIDDWEGIYYQGMLIYEGHHIQRWKLVSLMEKYNTFNVKEVGLDEAGEELIHDEGSFPMNFKEIGQYIIC